MGEKRPITLEYQKIGSGKWRKWNPVLGIFSTLEAIYDAKGNKTGWRITRQQPEEVLQAILDRNVAIQNSHKGHFRGDQMRPVSCIPIALHQQIMEKCGHQNGHGYDTKKFRQIINDPDYSKLKLVPGKI